MPRTAASRRLAPLLLVAALTTMVVTDSSGPAGASSAPARAAETCEQPDCFAAIAFNPATGAWGSTKNFPTRRQAKAEAERLCKSFDHKDKQCVVLGAVRGATCIGAAMKVKERTVLAHSSATAPTHRGAWTSARADLRGKQRFRHKIAAVCNG